jgi:hypothetical protein
MKKVAVAAIAAALSPAIAGAQAFPEFSFSGFGTLGAVRTDTDSGRYALSVLQPGGADTSWDASVDSLLGGQLDVRFTRSLSFVGQLVANKRAQDDFQPHVEWAFLRYAVTPDLAVRGGVLATPVFMLSDSRLVGISFPWVRPPTALYSQAPITNFRGIDLVYRVPIGAATLTLQPYLGEAPTDVPGTTGGVVKTKLDDVRGIAALVEAGGWSVGARYFESKFTYRTASTDALWAGLRMIAPQVPGAGALGESLASIDKKITFASVGATYDGARVFFQAEYGRRRTDLFLADTSAWYASIGYRFGNVMPHLTISEVEVDSPTSQRVVPPVGPLAALAAGIDSLLAGQNVAQETVAAGVRWQFHKNADLKVQWDRVKLPPGAVGNFRAQPGFASRVDVYSVAVDFVF